MPNYRALSVVHLVIIYLLLSLPAQAGMSSPSFTISSSVISGGGNSMSSAHYGLVSTLGQPSALGSGTSDSYSSHSGFWYTLLISITIGDVDGNGTVELEDLLTALQVATGTSVDAVYREADADGDSQIGIGETIMILRKIGNF